MAEAPMEALTGWSEIHRFQHRSIRYTRDQYDMWRAILHFTQGILCAALPLDAISVYVFHDVDKEMAGRWNEAFAGLCSETILFAFLVVGGVALLAWLGRRPFHLMGFFPRAKVSFFLGVGVSVAQYLWDFVARAAFPERADSWLGLYMIVAIVFCSIVLVRDAFNAKTMAKAAPQLESE